MMFLKRSFLGAALAIAGAAIPVSAQESRTQAPVRALDLLPGSCWFVARFPSSSRLKSLLETHPVWKLYGKGGRRRILEEVADSLGRKLKVLAEEKLKRLGPDLGEKIARFLRREVAFFSGLGEPKATWVALSRFSLGMKWERGRRGLRESAINYNPGALFLLEYPAGKEDAAGKAEKDLENAFREGLQGRAWKFRTREVSFHGAVFHAYRLELPRGGADLLFTGRFGPFLAVSFLSPWPLFEMQAALEGKAASLAGKDWSGVFRGTSPDRATFVLDPVLLPLGWIPEPFPLAWTELGLPEVRWIQGSWDPATGREDCLARTERPAGGYLAELARSLDPDELASLLPADTAAFAVMPFDWKGLAARLKPFLEEARHQGLLPGDIPLQKLVEGFAGESLSSSPRPMLAGTRALGIALRFNKGIPFPDVVVAIRLAKGYPARIRAFVEKLARRGEGVGVTETKGLKVYRGGWFGGETFVIKGNWVFVTPKAGMIRGFLPALAGEKPSLAGRERYLAFRKSFSSSPALAFFYVDGPGFVRTGESLARVFLPVANMFLQVQDLGDLLHGGDEIEEAGLGGYGGGIFLEREGIAWRSDFPFSLANLWVFGRAGFWAVVEKAFSPEKPGGKGL